MKTLLTKNQIKSACSKDDLRPALKGAYYQPKENRLTTCDGFMIIHYPVQSNENDSTAILPTDIFPSTVREAQNSTYEINGQAKRSHSGMIQLADFITEKYPDYKAVTPKDNPCFEIGIDLMKLKQLCDALPMSESKDKAVKLSFIAKQSAVLFETIHHENKIEGLIMPVRLK